jgi:uncharacterized protein (TIGR00369 family)
MDNPRPSDIENDPFDGALVRRFLESMPIFQLYGAKVIGFTRGTSELEIPWRRDLTFDGKTIQAGVSASLMDFAGGSAVATMLPIDQGIMTTGFEVHNTAPAVGDRLIAIGQAVHIGKRTGVGRADVYVERDGERTLCATGLVSIQSFKI